MQINLSGQHLEITPDLHNYVYEKFPKLSRFFDPIPLIHIVLKVEKLQHIAEATLQANGKDLHATASAATMVAAIDSLLDKLVRRLTKLKDKRHQHHAGLRRAGSLGGDDEREPAAAIRS